MGTRLIRVYALQDEHYYRSGKVIFIRKEKQLQAFSALCPHLGCTLDVFPDGNLVCPCHGSSFSMDGKMVQGPARQDLTAIPLQYDTIRNQYYAEVEEG